MKWLLVTAYTCFTKAGIASLSHETCQPYDESSCGEDLESVGLLQVPTDLGSAEKHECRDFPRWDGKRYTGAEPYTCLTYCQTSWCTDDSYRTPLRKKERIPTYVEGVVGAYYTAENMAKSPFHVPVVDRLGVNDSDYTSAHEAALTGTHWYPWDADYATNVLKAEGYSEENFPAFDLLKTYKSDRLNPPQDLIDACQKAGKVLGRRSWLMNEGTIRCEDVPDVVKDRDVGQLNSHGKQLRNMWLKACNESASTKKYRLTCYAGASQVMLWDANYNGANPAQITPRFNLPWDVACCCCGGGTSKNIPGGKMRFKVASPYQSIAAKLTPPDEDAEWGKFVRGGYINSRKKRNYIKTLYPDFKGKTKRTYHTKGIIYTFPTITFKPEVANAYPYGPDGSTCSDYELETDITRFSLQFKMLGVKRQWVDWAGYTCRYNFYSNACGEDGKQDRDNKKAFGGMEQYFNGMLKRNIVKAWKFKGRTPDISIEGMRRADAFKVCCVCGGGRKKNSQAPKTLIDMLADSYYLK
mmetsp:Transcript_34046/g.97930  ORF Transcript_34046/g.97930 Transcript_34046/m.97930 type:complete len:525 (+) Transcript_34046:47-1621(+)